jgi:D-glycerate 3-kinase
MNVSSKQVPLRVAKLAAREATPALADCVSHLDPSSPDDYRELAALLACEWVTHVPKCVGLAGGQGAGKSTLGRLIESACASVGIRACVLSLDDWIALATSVHPLLETRGPPGTHEILRCREAIGHLGRSGEIELPIFDKGLDDRSGTRRVRGPFDLVLLEGWCVGARSVVETSLARPINMLERERDPSAIWRRYVNAQLGQAYAETWRALDYLVYLRVPDLAAIRRWRLEQEDSLPAMQRLGSEAIERFGPNTARALEVQPPSEHSAGTGGATAVRTQRRPWRCNHRPNTAPALEVQPPSEHSAGPGGATAVRTQRRPRGRSMRIRRDRVGLLLDEFSRRWA